MSRMAWPEVCGVEITPGGMMLSPTSSAPRRRLTQLAGATMPTARATTEMRPTAASWGVVGSSRCCLPSFESDCPACPEPCLGASSAKCEPVGRSVMRPCLMPLPTIQTLAG